MDVPEGVDVLDLGTSGMSVLHELAGRQKAIFVDCALMGEPPGTLRRFTPDDVMSRKVQTRVSLHEGDLLNTIALARRLGTCPDDVVIFGIEPSAVEPGDELSSLLAAKLNDYVDAVRAELALEGRRRRSRDGHQSW
jgi:hydrogenase maturation protease